MTKLNVTYEFDAAIGPPVWPLMWDDEKWDPKAEPNSGDGKLAFSAVIGIQNSAIPVEPIELQQCYDALVNGGPLNCEKFSPEIRGLLALILRPGADAESENCNYDATRCLDALCGIDEDKED